MNRTYIFASIFATIALAASAQNATTTIAANATLKDGSSVKGEFATEHFVGSTIFAEELNLNPTIVKSLTFAGTNGESKVELANGDKFAMNVANDSFAIKSLLGELAIPRTNFRSIALTQRKVTASGDDGLVFHCTFDNEAAINTPAIGPKGTVCSREFTDGRINNALRVPVGSSAGIFTLPPETFGKEGCIEFWAKIEPHREIYRDCDPRMIFIKSPAGWFTVEYSSNNGGGRGGFCVRCFNFEYIKGGPFGGGYKYADVIPDVTAWHHYAFSWTEDALTIYIDGVALPGAFKTGNGRIDEEKLKSSSSIMGLPNDNTNPYNTEPNTPFIIDELKIWNHAKSVFDL